MGVWRVCAWVRCEDEEAGVVGSGMWVCGESAVVCLVRMGMRVSLGRACRLEASGVGKEC